MGVKIHPTAVVSADAELDDDVEIGPFTVIGPQVRIGCGTRLRNHVTVVSHTVIGSGCDIYPQAVLGGEPQDLKFRGEESSLIIGDYNIIRECVTINRGTALGGGRTIIGDRNLIMAYVHIAHDCRIGNQCVITNCSQLAGHIAVEDMAIISGMVAIHHFVTIGTLSFVAGLSAVRTDVPPYMIVDGNPARVRKLNLEGMRRRGMPPASVQALKEVFRLIYRSDLSRAQVVESLEHNPLAQDPAVQNLIRHFRASEAGCQGRALEALRADRKSAAACAGEMASDSEEAK